MNIGRGGMRLTFRLLLSFRLMAVSRIHLKNDRP